MSIKWDEHIPPMNGLRATIYRTPYGDGRLIWRDGLLVANHLPQEAGSGDAGLARRLPASKRRYCDDLVARLEAYFLGEVVDFPLDSLPVDWTRHTAFGLAVVRELARLKHGEVMTYAELAEAAGYPRAYRAAGSFLARNPLPVLLPCHRVIKSDGDLGSYSAGAGWKPLLLQLEGSRLSTSRSPVIRIDSSHINR